MNEELKRLISLPLDNATSNDDELLLTELKKAHMIMPIEIIPHNDSEEFKFSPIKLTDETGEVFLALFSDEEELMKSDIEFSVINIYTKNVAEMMEENSEFSGVAINPFSEFQLKIPLNEFIEIFKK